MIGKEKVHTITSEEVEFKTKQFTAIAKEIGLENVVAMQFDKKNNQFSFAIVGPQLHTEYGALLPGKLPRFGLYQQFYPQVNGAPQTQATMVIFDDGRMKNEEISAHVERNAFDNRVVPKPGMVVIEQRGNDLSIVTGSAPEEGYKHVKLGNEGPKHLKFRP